MKETVKTQSQRIVDAYLDDGIDPEETMQKVAEEKNLTAQQIEPIARRANRRLLVKLQNKAKENGKDPRINPPQIDIQRVVTVVSPDTQPKDTACVDPPDQKSTDVIDQVFGSKTTERQDHTQVGTADYAECPSKIPNQEMALRLLNKVRNKVESKKQKLRQIENKLEDIGGRLRKKVASHLKRGEPVEPFRALPVDLDNTFDKVAEHYDLQHLDESYELDEDHPIVEQAQKVASLQDDYESCQKAHDEAQRQRDAMRRALKDEGWLYDG